MGNKGRKENRNGGEKKPPQARSRPEPQVEEELDLHGQSIDEAMAQTELALARWRNRPGACLRIIHGQSSGNRDSIKGALRRNLETRWKSRVEIFRQEPGNPGATLIFLKA